MKLEHMHSLYIRCYSCNIFGTPSEHWNGIECGNCLSLDTVAYYIDKRQIEKLLAVAKAAKLAVNDDDLKYEDYSSNLDSLDRALKELEK